MAGGRRGGGSWRPRDPSRSLARWGRTSGVPWTYDDPPVAVRQQEDRRRICGEPRPSRGWWSGSA
ncbi:hypothetical protein EAO79_13810 [Plantibacter sp. PA-3-X8]|nr:hypothetical protein EAO79_13810 [Plantibacter sp. PA-3-X8]